MSDRGGWIVLHRKLLDKPIWFESTAEQKVILITLLLMANHAEKEWEWQGQKYVAKPGQFVTSLSKIAEVCGEGISFQNVRTALKRFEKYGFLTNESTNKNRLITINNWAFYQNNPNDTNIQPNKQLTSNQQATNKQLTTNNNDKQINNVTNNVVVDEKVDPISKAIRKLYGNRRIEEVPDHFKNPPQETHNPESVESARNALNQLLGGNT